MKRTFQSMACAAVLAAALLPISASAQPKAGTFSLIPRVGVALTNISHDELGFATSDTYSAQTKSGKYREGLVAGADLQYQATDMLALSLGAFYARQGCKYKDTDLTSMAPGSYTGYSDCRTSLDYINVPVMAHVYVAEGLSLNAGLQAGFLISDKLHYETTDVTINKDGSYTYANQGTPYDQKGLNTKAFDAAIPVGLSYEYANVVLDLRYNIGLTKVYNDINNSRNKAFMLTVGYNIQLGIKN